LIGIISRGYWTVVLLVVVWVVARLPEGVTALPVVEVWVLSVTTPLALVVCCVLVELEPLNTGGGAAVVDCVVVEVDVVCATATPVVIAPVVIAPVVISRARDAAVQYLVMLFPLRNARRAEIA
jgi:hypothetical protein